MNKQPQETRYALFELAFDQALKEKHLLIDNLSALSHSTPNPHATVYLVPVPFITCLHIHKEPEFIAIGIDFICQLGISKLS
jgi:hypothetical protein